MRIIVDAMGGDRAPDVVIHGAVTAARRLQDGTVVLVGDQARVEPVLEAADDVPPNIELAHAPQTIAMGEPPATAVRSKKDSSIVRAVLMCKDGPDQAFVSAGNTGACVAATMFAWRRLPGIERPGIAVTLPTLLGTTVLIDAGANVKCKAIHLLQYAVMAATYVRRVRGRERPLVGLVSIGEEEEKGNELVKSAQALLQASNLNYVGRPIEGLAIFHGRYDVVVCEGFVGNVVLKTTEGLAEVMLTMIAETLKSELKDGQAGAFLGQVLAKIQSRTDYAEYGGAPLLGVNGNCIICHGRSDQRAVSNAILVAADMVRKKINDGILGELESFNAAVPSS